MRLYGAIEKVEAQSDGTVRVYGIATSEVVDEQGEIVRADAMRAAMPEYMRFPALREMHQLSAAGTTLEAEVGEDGITRIVAHVVDPVAAAKVTNKVYRGFSIGGRVTQREAANPKVITGLVLNEISLVDRPANPEAVFDCWKAVAGGQAPDKSSELSDATAATTADRPFNAPIQVWACAVSDHRHLTKAEAVKCLARGETARAEPHGAIARSTASVRPRVSNAAAAGNRATSVDGHDSNIEYADPGYQRDGKERYPIDTESHIRAAWAYINRPGNSTKYRPDQLRRIRTAIIAAWKARIDKDGPPSAADSTKASQALLTKALWDVCRIARILIDLGWLKNMLDLRAAFENDGAQQLARQQEIITELADFLNTLLMAETGELTGDAELSGLPIASAMPQMLAMAVGSSGVPQIAAAFGKAGPAMRKLATDLVNKFTHSAADQALINTACRACDECLKMAGLSSGEMDHLTKARDHLQKAGGIVVPDWIADTETNNGNFPSGSLSFPSSPLTVDTAKALEPIAWCVGKRGQSHQCLMDIAHKCLSVLTGGMLCAQSTKMGARHPEEMMQHLEAARHHLVGAGAGCHSVAAASDAPCEGDASENDLTTTRNGCAADVAKFAAAERGDKAAMAKALDEILPMIEQLTRRVDEIARTPLPPLTMAKTSASLSKREDGVGIADTSSAELSSEAVAAALAKMSKEEQTLMLIKASHAKPFGYPAPPQMKYD